jgi:hypothetical protein
MVDETMAEVYCRKAEEFVAFIEKLIIERLADKSGQ